MMERSEAYYLIEQICDDYGLTIAEREALKMAMHDIEFVDLMPADVALVVHGEWIEDGYYDEPYVCSYCGEPCRDTAMGKPRWNLCPNCGADMRGRKGDDG